MEKKMPTSAYKGLGATLIFLGFALLATSALDLVFSTCNFYVKYVCSGLWSGIPCIVTGVLAVAVSKNSSHCFLSTHLSFSILACLLVCGPIVCGIIGLNYHLGDERGYVLSENPLQLCKDNVTSSTYYYDACYMSCCSCNYDYLGDNLYDYHFFYDFEGESEGIIRNSVLAGLGVLSLVISTANATLFCQATTCCPKTDKEEYMIYNRNAFLQYQVFSNSEAVTQVQHKPVTAEENTTK
ncbi:uncharacterized protein LOC136043822 [Artemia franciscana]|uniref:uncharacterized protein LOC136043822 n=1 Tax=Artemia franciscana TaxID=6661 RepID=UPI0032DAB650